MEKAKLSDKQKGASTAEPKWLSLSRSIDEQYERSRKQPSQSSYEDKLKMMAARYQPIIEEK